MNTLASSLANHPITENAWVLTLLALLPAIVLCVYVYVKDRVEKEPLGLLIGLLVLGAVSCFPAGEIEGVLGDWINAIFTPLAQTVEVDGETVLALPSFWYRIYEAVNAFIGVALVEEAGKWLVLILLTRKNKNFNSLFDGIVYAVFASLGFAALENVMYVFSYGFETGLMRMVTSIPGHMFFGVFMGTFYSFWKISCRAYEMEREMAATGRIQVRSPINRNSGMAMSLIVPVLVHGFYDYCLFVGSTVLVVIFYVFLIAMYIVCFGRIRTFSKADRGIDNYAAGLLTKKYMLQAQGYTSDEEEYSTLSDLVDQTADKS